MYILFSKMEEHNNNHSEAAPHEMTSSPSHPQEAMRTSRKKGGKKKKLIGLLVILGIIALLAGGGWFVFNDASAPVETEDVGSTLTKPQEDTKVATPTPTPTAAPLNRDEVTLIVYNGTGVPREASILGDALEDLGYSEIELKNADDQDAELEVTVVVFSKSLSQTAIDEITETLEDMYKEVEVKKSSSTDFDVEVTTGLRKGESAPTPTPQEDEDESTPTPTEAEATPTATE